MRSAVLVAISAFAIALGSTSVEAATAKPSKSTAQTSQSKSKSSKARTSKASKSSHSKARKSAVVTRQLPPLSQAQIDVSQRVQIGRADCEFNQSVVIEPDSSRFGAFLVKFAGKTYLMDPEETATGAVRLFDPAAGVVWLQIPVKSMLMNMNLGQRMVDACTQPAQRTAQTIAEARARAAAASLSASGPSAASVSADGSVTTTPPVQAEQSLPLLRN